MSSSSFRRNRLVCRIALELGLVDASATDEALRAWESSQETNLEDILFRAGAITEAHRSAIRALVDSSPSEPTRLPSGSGVPVDWDQAEADQFSVDEAASTDRKSSTAESWADLSEPDSRTRSWHASRSSPPRRFRFLREHARGGLGAVSVAEDVEFGREVALKEIRPEHVQSRESRDRFMFEGMVTGRLEHPGIVPVYSLGIADGQRPYYAMRFIRGESLRQAIKARFHPRENEPAEDQLPWLRRIVRRLIDVCNAISYAHSCGVVHRDLKPANIMLGPYGETLVVDWGLAKPLGPEQSPVVAEPLVFPEERCVDGTRQGSVVGTLAYMSPEQARGENDAIGPHTDVFCLGATLYCVLTGDAPYGGKDNDESRESIRNARFSRPRTANPSLPRSLEAICLKAMSAQPQDRYASAASLGEDLERWLIDEPVTAWPEPWLDRVGRFIRRNRSGVLSALALLALTTIGGIVFSLVLDNKNREINTKNLTITSANTQLTEARDSLDESLKTAREATMDMIVSADSGLDRGNPMRAQIMEDAFRMYDQIHRRHPANLEIAYEFARVLRMAGNLKRWNGELPAALERYRTADEVHRRLETMTLIGPVIQRIEHALLLIDQGAVMRLIGSQDEAFGNLDEARSIARLAFNDEAHAAVAKKAEALASEEQAIILSNRGAFADAAALARTAGEVFEAAAESPVGDLHDRSHCLICWSLEGKSMQDLERTDDAIAIYERAEESFGKWLEKHNENNLRMAGCRLLLDHARLLSGQQPGDSRIPEILEQALPLAEENLRMMPNQAMYAYTLADVFRLSADHMLAHQRADDARQALAKARHLLEPTIKDAPFPSYAIAFCEMLLKEAEMAPAPTERVALLEQAARVRKAASETFPNSPRLNDLCNEIDQALAGR